MADFLTNLHHSLQDQLAKNPQVKGFSQQISDITGKIPNLVGSLENLQVGYFDLRKKISKKLKDASKNHKLALESLGWGSLAAFLESAFCGDVLDTWG